MTDPSAAMPALGRLPSGLFVLTAAHQGDEIAMLASWVQQCGFDPPRVSVALGKDRPLAAWLIDARVAVVLNVVPDDGRNLVAHFGRGFAPGEPAFDGLATDRTLAAAPVLTAAAAYLDCRPVAHLDAGDHLLFVLEVVGGAVLRDSRPAVHMRKSGARY